jgi:hypothetical protein
MWWHTPLLYNPDNFLANPHNVFGKVASFNMVCLPRESATMIEGLPEIASPQAASALLRDAAEREP